MHETYGERLLWCGDRVQRVLQEGPRVVIAMYSYLQGRMCPYSCSSLTWARLLTEEYYPPRENVFWFVDRRYELYRVDGPAWVAFDTHGQIREVTWSKGGRDA